MLESKDESFEVEPTCIKNEIPVTPKPQSDHPVLKEQSGRLVSTSQQPVSIPN